MIKNQANVYSHSLIISGENQAKWLFGIVFAWQTYRLRVSRRLDLTRWIRALGRIGSWHTTILLESPLQCLQAVRSIRLASNGKARARVMIRSNLDPGSAVWQ